MPRGRSVMTITSIGYGDVVAVTWIERVVATMVMLVGSLLFGQVVGTLVSIISTFNPEAAEFRRTMDELNRFMNHHLLDHSLRQRLREYFHRTSPKMRDLESVIIVTHAQRPVIDPRCRRDEAHPPHARQSPPPAPDVTAATGGGCVDDPQEMACAGELPAGGREWARHPNVPPSTHSLTISSLSMTFAQLRSPSPTSFKCP